MDKYFEQLMSRSYINTIEEDGKMYGIRVLGRGSDLLFIDNNKGLICEIDAEHGRIYKKSIREWNSINEKMSKAEKERVTELILRFYKKIDNPNAQLK